MPLVLIPGFAAAVGAAAGWVGGQEVYLPTVLETQNLFTPQGRFTLGPVIEHTGLFFPAAILGLLLYPFWMQMAKRSRRNAQIFFLVVSVCLLALSANQIRFLMYGTVCIALLAAAVVAFPFLVRRGRILAEGPGRGPATATAALLSAVLLVHAGYLTNHRLAGRYRGIDTPLAGAFRWMVRGTPPTSHYLDPSSPPEYGILTTPGYGHHITYLARRPVSSNPFFDLDGLRRSTAFFLARDDDEAVRAMDAARCRYAFLTPRSFDSTRYAPLLDGEAGERWRESDPEERRIELLAETPCAGLYLFDGASSPRFRLGDKVLEINGRYDRFRLVYESEETLEEGSPLLPFRGFGGARVPFVKVFERVEGARVAGRAEPGTLVRLSVPVTTSAGRRFEFTRIAEPGLDGRYEFRVPYPERARVEVLTGDDFRTLRVRAVEIPEEAVLEGRVVEVAG
jgi:asparagine N-glycosylation enzyme membrane subunit Stt3